MSREGGASAVLQPTCIRIEEHVADIVDVAAREHAAVAAEVGEG